MKIILATKRVDNHYRTYGRFQRFSKAWWKLLWKGESQWRTWSASTQEAAEQAVIVILKDTYESCFPKYKKRIVEIFIDDSK